jgi:hypothetical protein
VHREGIEAIFINLHVEPRNLGRGIVTQARITSNVYLGRIQLSDNRLEAWNNRPDLD